MEELKMKLQQYLQAEENPCCSENSLHEKNKSQFMICCYRYVKKKKPPFSRNIRLTSNSTTRTWKENEISPLNTTAFHKRLKP
jgi:hypothetical protein